MTATVSIKPVGAKNETKKPVDTQSKPERPVDTQGKPITTTK